jgi:hypothetical protein
MRRSAQKVSGHSRFASTTINAWYWFTTPTVHVGAMIEWCVWPGCCWISGNFMLEAKLDNAGASWLASIASAASSHRKAQWGDEIINATTAFHASFTRDAGSRQPQTQWI